MEYIAKGIVYSGLIFMSTIYIVDLTNNQQLTWSIDPEKQEYIINEFSALYNEIPTDSYLTDKKVSINIKVHSPAIVNSEDFGWDLQENLDQYRKSQIDNILKNMMEVEIYKFRRAVPDQLVEVDPQEMYLEFRNRYGYTFWTQ